MIYATFIYMTKKKIRTKSKAASKTQVKRKVVKKTVKKPVKVIKKIKRVAKPSTPAIPREGVVLGKRPSDTQLLEQFFGGIVKFKLWKVFSLNTTREFTLKDLSRLTKTRPDTLIVNLKEMMKQGIVEAARKSIINDRQEKEQTFVYSVVKDFPLLPEITQLILTGIPRASEKVLNELGALPRLKTVLLSGFFTSKLGLSTQGFSATQSPIDMLLIFEKIPANVAESVAELEHKLGRDLRYAALDQDDFKYRHSIGDKLIRDVLDFDHVVAMDKMSFFK